MIRRLTLFNCPIDALTMKETVELIDNTIKTTKHLHHVIVNVAKVINMRNYYII